MRFFTLREALVLSLCLHLLLGGVLFIRQLNFDRPEKRDVVTVEILPAAQPTAGPPQAAPERRENVRLERQQIVEQEKSINQERPKNTQFLSAQDQSVQKETVAREKGEFRNLKDTKSKTSARSAGEKTDSDKMVAKGKPSLRDLTPSYDPQGFLNRKSEHEIARGGDDVDRKGGEASRTSDYLREVDQGLETLLNTREFKYYTYYNRIRRQLSQHWEPKVKDRLGKLFRQGRRIASDQDHVTKLLITLNEQGSLVKVQVLGESGVSDLDDAAMDAFRAAAPFPNPPKGIVEPDGTVKIRWDFVLES